MASSVFRKALLGLVSCAALVTPASALNIILNPDATFTNQPNGQAALLAFRKAANFWNKFLTNDATLLFNVSYAPLATNVIGSTGSNQVYTSVSGVYSALATHKGGALDDIAVANLRPLSAAGGLAYRMPDSVTGVAGTGQGLGLETVTRGSVLDNDDTDNNTLLYANTANLKALGVGFNVADTDFGTNADASITFSSNFAFDLNPGNGVSVGTQDFVSVAVHEMGHALGFVSGADLYDYYGNPNGPGKSGPFGNSYDWDTQPVLSVWDLFRDSANGGASGFDLATGKRFIQLDPNRGAGFSIDGVNFFNQLNAGVAEYANLSTGRYNGDLQQASHWKDATGFFDINNCFIGSRQIGIMDPTSGSCQVGLVTANDLAAFDAMGYNLNFNILNNLGFTFDTAQIFALDGLAGLVPEPATWMQMLAGFGLLGAALRRRNKPAVRVTFG